MTVVKLSPVFGQTTDFNALESSQADALLDWQKLSNDERKNETEKAY